jgi:hypothetical protein
MGINVQFKQAPPIILKNNMPNVYASAFLKNLKDVSMDNPINNSVLIYNPIDEKFHLDQLNIDGGTF